MKALKLRIKFARALNLKIFDLKALIQIWNFVTDFLDEDSILSISKLLTRDFPQQGCI